MERMVLPLCLSVILAISTNATAFVTGLGSYFEPQTIPDKPTVNALVYDAQFGTAITALTDSEDSASACATIYSHMAATNVDNTKVAALCTVGFGRFKVWDFDPVTMQRTNGRYDQVDIPNMQYYQAHWSHVSPDVYYSCARRVLYATTIPTDGSAVFAHTIVKDFSADIGGSDSAGVYCTEPTIDDHDEVFSVRFHNPDAGTDGYIVYRRSTDTILRFVTDANVDFNEVHIDKTGRYLRVCCYTDASVWDLVTGINTPVTVQPWVHGALGRGISIDAGTGAGHKLYSRSLSMPNSPVEILSDWGALNTDYHFSITGDDALVFICRHSTTGVSYSVTSYLGECIAVATNGSGEVRHYLHHYANVWGNTYNLTPRATISRDGQFLAWTSNWHGPDVSARTDVYLARIQNSRYAVIRPRLLRH